MNILYRVYTNDGQGGLVNYSSPIATTPDLMFVTPPLALSSDYRYAVRAFDADAGIEEANTDVRIRLIIDAHGNDVTSEPNSPHALFVRTLAAGTCRATWAYSANGQGGDPTGFYVYLSFGSTPDYTTSSATVAYSAGTPFYSCILSGLADGATYTVALRSYNSIATESNTSVVASVVGKWTPPLNVDSLTAVPTFAS